MIKPSRVIGDGYLHRWHILPRNSFLNIYLHRFCGNDDPRALHDHPFHSVSILLKGDLFEVYTKRGEKYHYGRRIRRWIPLFRRAEHAHRMVLGLEGDAWTIFITGPRIREWGFLCPSGWRHWKDFVDESGVRIGRGCD